MKGASGWYQIRCLLDSGSQIESITDEAARGLGLAYSPNTTRITGIGGRIDASKKITTEISSRVGKFNMELDLVVVPQFLDDQPSIQLEFNDVRLPRNIELADPKFYMRRSIEMILGARVLFQVLAPSQIKCNGGPTLQETALGWLVGGLVSLRSPRTAMIMAVASTEAEAEVDQEEEKPNESLDDLFKRFWALEEVTPAEAETTCNRANVCEEHFQQNTTIGTDGKFVVRLPFKNKPIVLGDSFAQAKRRLLSLERRLVRSPEIYEQYREFLAEYCKLQHMEAVDSNDLCKVRYYIPHSCVVKPESTSTKLRVVFDASAKTSNGRSLNDLQLSGPTIQRDLFDLLLDFRCYDKVITADIAKMYRQVNVHDEDTWYQCILWRNDPSEEIKAYRLKTVTYGEAASSFLACCALQQVGVELSSSHPSLSEIIQKGFYVDNLMMGRDSAEALLNQRRAVEAALLERGFPLRKWASNDPSIISDIPAEDLEQEIHIGDHDIIKTLGVAWSPRDDKFRFVVDGRTTTQPTMTKRQLASEVLRLYDPLGIMQPAIVTAKILLQSLWKPELKIDWDDPIPSEVLHEWQQLKKTLPKLAELDFPRRAIPSNAVHVELHGFSDASARAYGGAIYAYSVDPQGNKAMHLLCAKSIVARKGELTMPRKELIGAKLLAELMNRVISIIPQHDLKVHYWCDSQVVLAWIRSSEPHEEVYVRNRIQIIQRISDKRSWKYVPTDQNPADIISRGITARKLLTTKRQLWLHATPYVLEARPETPVCAIQLAPPEAAGATDSPDHAMEDLILSYKYHNSLPKTRRHFALIYRAMKNFISKSSNRGDHVPTVTGPLTVDELEAGMRLAVKNMQLACLNNEFVSIRCNGAPTKQGP